MKKLTPEEIRAKELVGNVRDILKDFAVDEYERDEWLSIVCRQLSEVCELMTVTNPEKKDELIKKAKTFKGMESLFKKQFDKDVKHKCRVEVLIDKKEKGFVTYPPAEGKRFLSVIPAKGKKLDIIERYDGTTQIEFWGTTITIPTRIVKYFQMQRGE